MTRDLLFILSGPALVLIACLGIFYVARRDARRAGNTPGE